MVILSLTAKLSVVIFTISSGCLEFPDNLIIVLMFISPPQKD